MRDDTILLLGAGASAEAGFPIARQLLPKIRGLDKIGQDERAMKCLRLVDWCTANVLPGDDVEELMTFAELLESGVFSVPQWPVAFDNNSGRRLEESLEYLVSKLMQHCESQVPRDRFNPYEMVARQFRGTVISLNWDLMVENGYRLALGKRLRSYGEDAAEFSLLKLHGSINCLYCPSCGSLKQHDESVHSLLWDDVGRWKDSAMTLCDRCPELSASGSMVTLAPLIVPPTVNKIKPVADLAGVWRLAGERLREASRVLAVGCSLSYGDYPLRLLLRKEAARTTWEMTVVNQSCPPVLRDRFSSLFGDDTGRLHFREDVFSAFISELLGGS